MVDLENWDPLHDEPSTPELISLAKKRQIKNILKSYTGWYDPLSELIQNALDAVERRREQVEENYQPEITVEINLRDNFIRVTDNGIGFEENQLRYFLRPDISFKDPKQTRGNKGVGATYLAYGFNQLEFGTKKNSFQFYGVMKNAREWVEDSSNALARPIVQKVDIPPRTLDLIDQGSTFLLKFDGNHVRPKNLDWLNLNNAKTWTKVLRVVTPLGGVYLNSSVPEVKSRILVVDKDGHTTEEKLEQCEYLYPHVIFPNCVRLQDIQTEQKSLIDKGKDTIDSLPPKFKKLYGIYEKWDVDEILKNEDFTRYLTDEHQDLLRELQPVVYGFFTYTLRMWEKFNQDELGLRKGHNILKGGLQIATRHMVQGDLIQIPLTRTIGYQKTSLVLVELRDAEPDLGRKGFQPEITRVCELLSTIVVNYLKRWNKLLARDTGSPIDLSSGKSIYEWIKEQEKHATEHPLKINNKNFFLPKQEISILSEPQSEQDVIVLFNQLLAGGVIRGIEIFATSSSETYDSVCKALVKEPFELHEYDETTNPLGIIDPKEKAGESEPWILEYKKSLDALIEDFEKEEKDEKTIKLVVCWEMGKLWEDRYSITSLLSKDHLNLRPFHAATHSVKNTATDSQVFYLIVLKDLIEYLNDPEQSEITQKLYST